MLTVADACLRIEDAGLLAAPELNTLATRWNREHPNEDQKGELFVAWLSDNGRITDFHAEAILAGHSQSFMLGPYRVDRRLGSSGLGAVYRAVHTELDHPVSLKIFPKSLEQRPFDLARMERQARASVELNHPNVLRIFQIGKVGDHYFLASQDLSGESLGDWLHRDGRLSHVAACKVIRQAALGIAHLHDHGMIHRAVCPDNIWITENGSVKLLGLDWVLDVDGSFVMDDLATLGKGALIGAPAYMSPEQADDPESVNEQADVYALGATLYECLSGRPPFANRETASEVVISAGAVAPVAAAAIGIPEELCELVDAMLSTEPENRPRSARDVAVALEQFLETDDLAIAVEDAVPTDLLTWLRQSDTSEPKSEYAMAQFESSAFIEWLSE